jgi:hypothetical protein
MDCWDISLSALPSALGRLCSMSTWGQCHRIGPSLCSGVSVGGEVVPARGQPHSQSPSNSGLRQVNNAGGSEWHRRRPNEPESGDLQRVDRECHTVPRFVVPLQSHLSPALERLSRRDPPRRAGRWRGDCPSDDGCGSSSPEESTWSRCRRYPSSRSSSSHSARWFWRTW